MSELQTPTNQGPQLTPIPLPDVPVRRKRLVWPWVLATLFALLACCGVAAVGAVWVVGESGVFGPDGLFGFGVPSYGSYGSSAWTPDGRFAVMQRLDDDGSPMVIAYDISRGQVDSVRGYALAAVEPTGALLWLVPMTAAQGTATDDSGAYLPGMGDPTRDAPATTFARWDLVGDGPQPEYGAEPEWTPLVSDTGATATFGIDPRIGANPSKARIDAPTTKPHDLAIPRGVATFRVVGWSPSGEYLALEELVGAEEEGAALESDYDEMPERRLLIYSVDQPEPVFNEPVLTDSWESAIWDGTQDVVLWVDDGSMPSDSNPDMVSRLMAATPDGEFGEGDEVLGFRAPPEFKDAWSVALLGAGPSGLLLGVDFDMSDTQIWRVSDGKAEQMGSAPILYGASWREGSGLLLMEEVYESGEAGYSEVLSLYDESGEHRRELWSSPLADIGGY